MIDFIIKYFYYVFLGLIILTVIQRKHRGTGDRKRLAALIAGILVFIMYIGALGIKTKNLDQIWILLPFSVDLSLVYVLRSRLFIFKTRCINCGNKLTGSDIFFTDSNRCSDCGSSEEPAGPDEENREKEEAE